MCNNVKRHREKAWKAKTTAENYQQLKSNPDPCQHKLISAGSVSTDGLQNGLIAKLSHKTHPTTGCVKTFAT